MALEGTAIAWEWATPMLMSRVSDADTLNGELEGLIREQEALFRPADARIPDTPRAWNQFSDLHRGQKLFDWPGNAIKRIRNEIHAAVDTFLNVGPRATRAVPHDVFAWANIHRFGDWHGYHTHGSGSGELAAGVYWVRVPPLDTGAEMDGHLVLFDPRGPLCPSRYKKVIQPKAGHILVHPAWLAHEVAPNRASEPRISIAFDVLLRPDGRASGIFA